MISLYSGTPGSGKSYHAVMRIRDKLMSRSKLKNTVISNFALAINNKRYNEKFFYKDNSELTTDFFIQFALDHHVPAVEAQTLVVIDEAQILFNSRDWGSNSAKRMDWIKFFSQHRHYGYDFILIAQFDRMLDRQIRCLIEYNVTHHKMNQWLWFLPITTFLAVTHWYGQKIITARELIPYRKKIANLYNSYVIFDNLEKEKAEKSSKETAEVSEGEATEERGIPPEPPTVSAEIINFNGGSM